MTQVQEKSRWKDWIAMSLAQLPTAMVVMACAACHESAEPPKLAKQTEPVESVGRVEQAEPMPRLAVGERAHPFRLQDQRGEERTLQEILAQGSVALVFYRSADW